MLSVELVLANYGGGVTPTAAAPADAHAGLPQNWDQEIPAATRFVVLSDFANAAVRDNETGLVWEKSPDTTARTWDAALSFCIYKNVGGRKGWRLPSIPELASLVDPSVAFPGPTLLPGHPFTNVQSAHYWSAATIASSPTNAWPVNFGGLETNSNKTLSSNVWCVRGGMNADQY